jgi:hypothetical protein
MKGQVIVGLPSGLAVTSFPQNQITLSDRNISRNFSSSRRARSRAGDDLTKTRAQRGTELSARQHLIIMDSLTYLEPNHSPARTFCFRFACFLFSAGFVFLCDPITAQTSSFLQITGTTGQSAMFSSTTDPNNILIKGAVGTMGGLGIQTDAKDPYHTTTALLSNSLAIADGFRRNDPNITSSELVLESNWDSGGGVKQNEFYWQNDNAFRPLYITWQPVSRRSQMTVFGSLIVSAELPNVASSNYSLATFREAKHYDYANIAVVNTDPTTKGAAIVLGADANSFVNAGWNVGNDLFSLGRHNFFITDRVSLTQPFFIDDLDRIGMGTINPLSKLHVISTAEQLRIGYNDSNYWRASTSGSGLTQFDAIGSAPAFNFLDSVGIATVSPFAQLAITGNGTGNLFAINSSTGQRVLTVTSSGKVGVGTTSPSADLEVASGRTTLADSWNTRSSRRWKTNIQTIENALDEVRKLRGVTYDWKDGGRKDIGLIAEEVGHVLPEIVSYEANGVDAQSVDYQRIVAVLIEAIKEQDKEIGELREQVGASKPPGTAPLRTSRE